MTDPPAGADSLSTAACDASEPPSRRQLWVLGLTVALVRWIFAADRSIFHVAFDEPAQLAIGRTLAGRTKWNLFDLPTWQPGFGTLIAPVFMVTDNSVVVYRVAIGVNAVLGGVGAVLLALLARRITTLSTNGLLAATAGVSLLPAGLSASAHTWAEPLVTVSFNATVLALVCHWARPSTANAAFGVAFAGLGFLAHGRVGPLVAVAAFVVALRYHRQGQSWRGVVWIATSVVLTSLTFVYAQLTQRLAWDQPASANGPLAVIERVGDPVAVVEAWLGQLWYLLVTSAMLAGVGMAVLVRAALQPSDIGVRSLRAPLTIVLASVVSMMAISAVFMSDRTDRPDMVIYGRYNDAVIGIVLVVGAAQLAQRWRANPDATIRYVGAWLALTGAIAILLQARRHALFEQTNRVDEMIAGLAPLPFAGVSPAVATLVTAGLIILGLGAARLAGDPRRVLVLAAPLFIATLGVLTYVGLRDGDDNADIESSVGRIRQVVPAGTEFGVRFVPASDSLLIAPNQQLLRVQTYQFYLPEYSFERDRGFDERVGPFVFAPRFNDEFVNQAESIWIDPGAPMALWLEPRSSSDRP